MVPELTPERKARGASGAHDPGVIRNPERYGAAALERAARDIATAPPGNRHGETFRAAASIGEVVASGALSESEALEALTAAALERAGPADKREAAATVRDGIRQGMGGASAAPAPRAAAPERRNGSGPTKGAPKGQRQPAPAGAPPAATYASLADFERRRGLPAGNLATVWKVTEGTHDRRRALSWPTVEGMRRRVKFIDGGKGYTWTGKGGATAHLYGLPLALKRLADDLSAPLYVVNGEPSVWAAAAGNVAAICFGVGEASTPPPPLTAELAAALEGIRHRGPVRVVYDADDQGRDGGPKVAAALAAGGLDAAALDLAAWQDWQTHGMPAGADVGDLFQATGADDLADALASLPPMKDGQEPAPPGVTEGKQPSESQAAALVRIGKTAELFCDEDGRSFATITRNSQQETHAVKSTGFKRWLVFSYSREQGGRVPTASTIADALNVLEGHAAYADGAQVLPVHVRYAEHGERIYVDLGGPDWRAVEVSADGWQVIEKPPVRFRRAKAMGQMPEPERGGSLDLLRDFVNLDADDWPLFLGWLVCAMRPRGPYPVLVLGGEQGSSKSTIMKVARRLVDPNTAPLRAEPKEARDLMISANNGWCLALDNLDRVEPWLSNALCRLATGGGFSVRTNYADDEETIFQATRPVALNGIGDVATRPDLLDRSLMLAPPTIAEDKRQTEAAFWRAFELVEGRIFGAMLDALSTAIRRLPDTRLERLPRMADAALWVAAAEPGLGQAPGAFVRAMEANKDKAVGLALEASPVAEELMKWIDLRSNKSWTGTMGELLTALQLAVPHDRPLGWPKNATGLAAALRRIAPALRDCGIAVRQLPRDGGRRPWSIERTNATKKAGGEPSQPSQPSQGRPGNAVAGDGCDTCDGCDTFPPKSFVMVLPPAEPALLQGEIPA